MRGFSPVCLAAAGGDSDIASFQRAQKPGPEALVLGVTDVEAENLPAPVGCDPDGDDHRLGHQPVVDAGFAVGGIKEHIWIVDRGKIPVPKHGDLLVQACADARHLGLGGASISTESLDEVVDFADRDAMQIRLHHHGEQRLVDPTTTLGQRR